MELLKRSYEISVWDTFPKEKKILVIGGDQVTSLAKAVEPILTRNVNGTVTLEFKIYTQFFDSSTGQVIDNPYIPFLMTERVIKLKYKGKWYDLIIKNRVESSDQKMYTYTAKSLYINELSKNGFELEFNTELENNQGTIFELGEKILDGSGWTVDKKGSTILRSYVEDQLIICRVVNSNYKGTSLPSGNSFTIPKNSYVYTFYSEWENFQSGTSKKIQVLYIKEPANKSYTAFDQYILDKNLYTDDGVVTAGTLVSISPKKANIKKAAYSKFRGKYLARRQKTRYNSVLGKYVSLYTTVFDGNKRQVEGYTETEVVTTDLVQNFIVNSKEFESTSGWYAKPKTVNGNPYYAGIDIDIYPPLKTKKDETDKTDKIVKSTAFNSRLKITPSQKEQIVYNTAFKSNISNIKEIKANDTFILRYRFKGSKDDGWVKNPSNKVTFQFRLGDDVILAKSTKNPNVKYVNGCCQLSFTFGRSYKKSEVENIDFELKTTKTTPIYLDEIQLFRKIEAIPQGEKKKRMLEPGEVPEATTITKKYYYSVYNNKDKKRAEDYSYLSNSRTYTPVYDENYQKVTSIEKSQSNRFNLIQELCEAFECWANFVIEHDDYGRIKSKKIQFKEYVGERKFSGFRYGINLNSIQRTVDSAQIVTKTIIKANSNQHGENGFCTISRAKDNPSKENYILNFDYYVNQGMIDRESLNNDLYTNFKNYGKGFYKILKDANVKRDKIAKEYSSAKIVFLQKMALLTAATELYESTKEYISSLYSDYKTYTKKDFPNLPDGSTTGGSITDDKIIELVTAIRRAESVLTQATKDKDTYSSYTQEAYDKKETEYENKIKSLTPSKQIKEFFDKYKNFIQEGTWNSEEYYDDNLYYLEGLNVARTSSRPKVTYSINVTDIGMLEGYSAYDIDVGDKTFIEDVEFFGYVYINSGGSTLRQPYREEVVVTEIKEFLDSPEKNSIQIQNYKNQFDDLFQRITAATEQLQYASGGYNRASVAFNNDGTINADILQSTMATYPLTIQNADNKSIVWDSDGFKAVDTKNLNKIIQITGGKIGLSEDGGKTFLTAITAEGINTNMLTAGQINTDKILIGNSKDFAFRWDKIGLNAYSSSNLGYNYGKFVRFDKYGIYGYSKGDTNFKPKSLDDVKKNSDFGLTWDGFFLRSSHNNGYIEIDKQYDFRVMVDSNKDGNYIDRIKIGLLDDNSSNYGIRIKNDSGTSVFETTENGDLKIIGVITATEGYFKGAIKVGSDTTYITIDGSEKNSSIYSSNWNDSNEASGWKIDKDGMATFNNITLRGALKCAVLEYAEVQAVGGIMMIRPASTIKKAEFLEEKVFDGVDKKYYNIIKLTVENPELFATSDWCKITTEANDDIEQEVNGKKVLYSGININLFLCIAKGTYVYLQANDKEDAIELVKEINSKSLGLVNLGQINSVGLGLNSSTNNAMLPQTSFSVFSLKKDSNNIKYLKPHIILGKIPDDDAIYGNLSGKFGLYADAVHLTGNITATSGTIGGWEIDTNALNYRYSDKTVKTFFRPGADSSGFYRVGEKGVSTNGWLLWTSEETKYASGTESRVGTFGITTSGELHALNITVGANLKITQGSISSSYVTSNNLTTFALFPKPDELSLEQSQGIFKSSAEYKTLNLYLRFSNIIKIGTAEYSSGSKYGVIELNGHIYVKNNIYVDTLKVKTIDSDCFYSKITTSTSTPTFDYCPIRPVEQTHQKVGSNYSPKEKDYQYFLGTESYRWDKLAVVEVVNTTAYSASESGNTSDERKKNSITELPDEYSILFDKLNAVIYKYNDGNSNRFHTGFIAQDVEKALAESGLTTQDFAAIMHKQGIDEEGNEVDCYYLRYGEFVALNTNEIQKLKKRVAELENQLAKLTNKETAEPFQNLES